MANQSKLEFAKSSLLFYFMFQHSSTQIMYKEYLDFVRKATMEEDEFNSFRVKKTG